MHHGRWFYTITCSGRLSRDKLEKEWVKRTQEGSSFADVGGDAFGDDGGSAKFRQLSRSSLQSMAFLCRFHSLPITALYTVYIVDDE
jgi:hypothetical protein